jgi:small-conductance mechanosensitive channel
LNSFKKYSIVEQEKRSIHETSLVYRTKSWTQNESLFFENYHSIVEVIKRFIKKESTKENTI